MVDFEKLIIQEKIKDAMPNAVRVYNKYSKRKSELLDVEEVEEIWRALCDVVEVFAKEGAK